MESLGRISTKKITYLGLMLTVALILSYIESLIPFDFAIPGIKLGLANLCIVIMLSLYGVKEALIVNILRILIAGFMFGNVSMIIYSTAGALLSLLVMILFKKINKFSICGISLVGGVFHNVGQCIIASLVVSNVYVFSYLPVLIIVGAITGFVIGIIGNAVLPIIKRF